MCKRNDEPSERVLPPGDLISIEAAARYLQRGTEMVRRYCVEGRLPGAHRVGDGHRAPWVIPRQSVLDFSANQGQPMHPGVSPDDLISVEEAARMLNITPQMVQHECRNGHLPGARKVGDGHRAPWVIPRQSVLNYTPRKRGRRWPPKHAPDADAQKEAE